MYRLCFPKTNSGIFNLGGFEIIHDVSYCIIIHDSYLFLFKRFWCWNAINLGSHPTFHRLRGCWLRKHELQRVGVAGWGMRCTFRRLVVWQWERLANKAMAFESGEKSGETMWNSRTNNQHVTYSIIFVTGRKEASFARFRQDIACGVGDLVACFKHATCSKRMRSTKKSPIQVATWPNDAKCKLSLLLFGEFFAHKSSWMASIAPLSNWIPTATTLL